MSDPRLRSCLDWAEVGAHVDAADIPTVDLIEGDAETACADVAETVLKSSLCSSPRCVATRRYLPKSAQSLARITSSPKWSPTQGDGFDRSCTGTATVLATVGA